MEKNFNSLEGCKRHLEHFSAQNVKGFEKMNYEAALKNGRRQWNKMVNMLFNKVLGKN